jgi:hypothetical protein
MVTLRISDCDPPGLLSVELRQVLNVFGELGPRLHWAILDLEAISSPKAEWDQVKFETQISQSGGVSVSWKKLMRIASALDVVHNIILVGCERAESIPRFEPGQLDVLRDCDASICLVDSSFWEVSCRLDEVISRMQLKFKQVQIVNHPNDTTGPSGAGGD